MMFVKQAENVVLLLQFFAERLKPANLGDVADHFGWPRSSTFNLLSTLERIGFLYKVDGRKGYYPTSLWLDLATAIAEADPIPERLRRIVDHLAQASGETVWLSRASGMFRLNIFVRESDQQVRVAAPAGDRLPIHVGASGHALLSRMKDEEIDRILRKTKFHPYSDTTPLTQDAVMQEIVAGRRRGWFASRGNYAAGLGAVSVPVVDSGRVMALTIAGPLFRVENEFSRLATMIYEAISEEYGASCSVTA